MKIKGIVWLEQVIEKLERKHGVSQDEVREVFANSPHFRFVEKGTAGEKMCIRRSADRFRQAPDCLLCAKEWRPGADCVGPGNERF